MVVQVVNPRYPHQVWFISNLTCCDGTPWDGCFKKEKAKQFANFIEIGDALDKFVARFPVKQVIIHCE